MYNSLIEETKRTEFPHFGSGAGDGIVYVGGGKYWPMIVAGIRVMRDTGCTLPVEVWYRGDCEEVHPNDVIGLNVRLMDVDKISRVFKDWRLSRGDAKSGGWEAKVYAIYHTNFDRILFLDADAYAVENPENLFELLDIKPFVYWRDLPKQDHVIRWDDVYPNGKGTRVPPVQGGQLLFDRIKCQTLISVCNWMCQHSDYYFKKMYGDQDTWRVGLAMGLSKYICFDSIKWVHGIAFDCQYQDRTYILHRCRGKLFAPKHIPSGDRYYTNPNYKLPREHELFTYFGECLNNHDEDSAEVFNEIMERRLWGPEGISGAGSTLFQTRPVVDLANHWFRKYNIQSVVDAGCGDGLTGSLLNVQSYVGIDVVDDLVRLNAKKYPRLSYATLDIQTEYDIIGCADCLFCKDVLHHWPNAKIEAFFESLIRSRKFRYIIFVFDSVNVKPDTDCHIGGYRSLSLKDKRFSKFEIIESRSVHYKTAALLELKTDE